jgi:type I restriction enzyme M protein
LNYETPAAFRMALEAHLANRARAAGTRARGDHATGADLNRLRRRVVFERLLVRLDDAQRGSWVLKGGMALELRWHDRARATRDLDLATRVPAADADGLRAVLAETLERDPHGDWFQFLLGSARALTADVAGRPGWRFPVQARLAGRQFAQVSVDVVVRAEEIGGTERVALPGALAFAGLPPASFEVVDRDQHFAEKLHALTQTYGDRPNTRTRDLVDLLMLIEDGLRPTKALHASVRHVFAVRGTHELPADLPDPPSDWAQAYPSLAADLELDANTIDRAMEDLQAFWALVRSTQETSMPRRAKPTPPTTPQAKLSGVIKTVRDTMRKDAGLNGDLDRIPQLAWLLFLKAFDGLEERRQIVEGSSFTPAIAEPYRWRDWAADPVDGRTGDTLIDFVNNELLPHLRSLRGSGADDSRDVLAAVFKETFNRMLSGYLLRDVLNKIDEVNFASSDDIHTMAHLYESMLRDMRDAAGDSGEFYTPRPVIRFMVEQVNLTLGERVLDPACGTGGFLVEALEHLRPTLSSVEEVRALEDDLRGTEKKPLPYLLGMMNLLLHEVQQPHLQRVNALARPVTEIRRADLVDVVLTNPPFGGEEEKAIQANFPEATRTAETAWLFIQLVQRVLDRGGRCAIVVPNKVLFDTGVGAKVKSRLLAECNLHTIVRLPQGVFAPYTTIPTNLMFFEKTGRTKTVWFYELPPPEGHKGYAKTRPLRFDEFADCQSWWGGPTREGRKDGERAWQVPIADLEASDYNLDLRNPQNPDDLTHRPPAELLTELLESEEEIMRLLCEIEDELGNS